jgi:hypothetical protein
MKSTSLILLLGLVLLNTGCARLFGVKQLNGFQQDEYDKFVTGIRKKRPTINFVGIVSDTSQYRQVINLGNTAEQKNDFGQPIQILYFEYSLLKSYHANCYARGSLTNLNWNTDNRFAGFLPKSAVDTTNFSVKLKDYTKIYPQIDARANQQYTVVIFWTLMLEKISANAIETVMANIDAFNKTKETTIFLINSDKFFSTISNP